MSNDTIQERIAKIAIQAIKDIVIAVVGTGVENSSFAEEVGEFASDAAGAPVSYEAEPQATAAEPPKRGRGRPPKNANGAAGEPAVATTTAMPSPPPQPAVTEDSVGDLDFGADAEVTSAPSSRSPESMRKDMNSLLVQLMPRIGKERLGGMLAKRSAARPSEIKDEQLPELLAELNRLMESTNNPGATVTA